MIYQLGDRRVVTKGDYWVAENASVIGSVVLEHNVSIWFNAILRGDNDVIVVGEGSNIQDGCILHTDDGIRLTIGANVTVGHNAMLHGCSIGEGSLIGIKATILDKAVIGKYCLIGAHALVTPGKKIPDRSLVFGSPAKVVRELDDNEVERISLNAKHYVKNLARYQQLLKVQQNK